MSVLLEKREKINLEVRKGSKAHSNIMRDFLLAYTIKKYEEEVSTY